MNLASYWMQGEVRHFLDVNNSLQNNRFPTFDR